MDYTKVKEHSADRLPTQCESFGQVRIPTQDKNVLEKEFDKMIRQPRSRKFSNAIKNVDIPSMEDEALMSRLKEAHGIVQEEDVVFTPEDMESFRRRVQEDTREAINKELEKQKRLEEELEAKREQEALELERIFSLEEIVAKCSVAGCKIHSITSSGDIKEHMTLSRIRKLGPKYTKAQEILDSQAGWTYVEIYGCKLVHRTEKGDFIKSYPMLEE